MWDVTGDPTQDDAYAALFRPEAPAPTEPPVTAEAETAEPVAEEPAAAPTAASTGRLFRSSAAGEATAAIPALRSDQVRGLRTVGAGAIAAAPAPSVAISTSTSTPTITPEPVMDQAPTRAGRRREKAARTPEGSRASAPRGAGLGPAAVLLVVVVVTLVAGLIDVLIGAGLGWIWGVGMLVSSGYAAFAARRGDGTYAVTAPAIAALASVLTVAQLNLGASGGSLFDRAVVAFFALGDHWTWIVGSTVIALVIVAVRARTRRD